jgi:TonB family protein
VDVVKVVHSLDRDIDQAAVETVKEWKFEPATRNGQPVPVQTDVTFNFNLE